VQIRNARENKLSGLTKKPISLMISLPMESVKVLIQGYVKYLPDGVLAAAPSTVLISKSQKNLLVDPGSHSRLLLDALHGQGLQPQDIDLLFLTHYHLDHILNMRLFPHQDIYDGAYLYRDDLEIPCAQGLPLDGVTVVKTPGHSSEHASLIVETGEGRCAVAGDVFFWWEDGREPETDRDSLLNLPDAWAQDLAALRQSRLKLLQMADFIIPGHGKVFREAKKP
jgi:glyoxylase-like metal-dependent hydrolase (beta-lactamase superfamily II)